MADLALIHSDESGSVIEGEPVREGAFLQVQVDGKNYDCQSAYDGWQAGPYRLAKYTDQDPVPEGKRIASTEYELIDGVPTFVVTLEDIVISSEQVNVERDRRIDAGFNFNSVMFGSDPEDRENIAGAKSAAGDAIAAGAEAGDFAWQQLLDPSMPAVFAWIAADNTLVPMDAPTVVQFGYAALSHKQQHIFAARTLKDMDPIPSDYATNEAYWP